MSLPEQSSAGQLTTERGSPTRSTLDRLLRSILLLGVALLVLAFFYLTVQRVAYPFELEWMEGALVDHTSRLMRGEDLYVAPSVEHISYLYTPLFYYASAIVSWFTGVGFLPLRLVSLFASLGCALVVAQIVRSETTERDLLPAVVGGGFFLAGYWLVDGWFDLARNDSLFLLLILVTVKLLRGDTDRRAVLAGAVVVLAFLSKQLTLVLLPPLAIGMACVSFRRAVLFTVSTTVCLGVTVGLYSWLTDGWFFYFIFELPSRHPPGFVLDFWGGDLRPLWISLAIGLFWLATGLRQADRRATLFYTCVAVGLFVSVHVARHHAGGHINALMPWLAGGGILMGLAAGRLSNLPGGLRLGLGLAMIGQFAWFAHGAINSKSFLPSPEHRREFARFQEYLHGVDGGLFVPCHGHIAEAVGRTGSMHGMALYDLFTSKIEKAGVRTENGKQEGSKKVLSEEYKILLRSLGEAYTDRRFKVIVIDDPHYHLFLGGDAKVIPGYRLLEKPPFDHSAMHPINGMFTTPAFVFVRLD